MIAVNFFSSHSGDGYRARVDKEGTVIGGNFVIIVGISVCDRIAESGALRMDVIGCGLRIPNNRRDIRRQHIAVCVLHNVSHIVSFAIVDIGVNHVCGSNLRRRGRDGNLVNRELGILQLEVIRAGAGEHGVQGHGHGMVLVADIRIVKYGADHRRGDCGAVHHRTDRNRNVLQIDIGGAVILLVSNGNLDLIVVNVALADAVLLRGLVQGVVLSACAGQLHRGGMAHDGVIRIFAVIGHAAGNAGRHAGYRGGRATEFTIVGIGAVVGPGHSQHGGLDGELELVVAVEGISVVLDRHRRQVIAGVGGHDRRRTISGSLTAFEDDGIVGHRRRSGRIGGRNLSAAFNLIHGDGGFLSVVAIGEQFIVDVGLDGGLLIVANGEVQGIGDGHIALGTLHRHLDAIVAGRTGSSSARGACSIHILDVVIGSRVERRRVGRINRRYFNRTMHLAVVREDIFAFGKVDLRKLRAGRRNRQHAILDVGGFERIVGRNAGNTRRDGIGALIRSSGISASILDSAQCIIAHQSEDGVAELCFNLILGCSLDNGQVVGLQEQILLDDGEINDSLVDGLMRAFIKHGDMCLISAASINRVACDEIIFAFRERGIAHFHNDGGRLLFAVVDALFCAVQRNGNIAPLGLQRHLARIGEGIQLIIADYSAIRKCRCAYFPALEDLALAGKAIDGQGLRTAYGEFLIFHSAGGGVIIFIKLHRNDRRQRKRAEAGNVGNCDFTGVNREDTEIIFLGTMDMDHVDIGIPTQRIGNFQIEGEGLAGIEIVVINRGSRRLPILDHLEGDVIGVRGGSDEIRDNLELDGVGYADEIVVQFVILDMPGLAFNGNGHNVCAILVDQVELVGFVVVPGLDCFFEIGIVHAVEFRNSVNNLIIAVTLFPRLAFGQGEAVAGRFNHGLFSCTIAHVVCNLLAVGTCDDNALIDGHNRRNGRIIAGINDNRVAGIITAVAIVIVFPCGAIADNGAAVDGHLTTLLVNRGRTFDGTAIDGCNTTLRQINRRGRLGGNNRARIDNQFRTVIATVAIAGNSVIVIAGSDAILFNSAVNGKLCIPSCKYSDIVIYAGAQPGIRDQRRLGAVIQAQGTAIGLHNRFIANGHLCAVPSGLDAPAGTVNLTIGESHFCIVDYECIVSSIVGNPVTVKIYSYILVDGNRSCQSDILLQHYGFTIDSSSKGMLQLAIFCTVNLCDSILYHEV